MQHGLYSRCIRLPVLRRAVSMLQAWVQTTPAMRLQVQVELLQAVVPGALLLAHQPTGQRAMLQRRHGSLPGSLRRLQASHRRLQRSTRSRGKACGRCRALVILTQLQAKVQMAMWRCQMVMTRPRAQTPTQLLQLPQVLLVERLTLPHRFAPWAFP